MSVNPSVQSNEMGNIELLTSSRTSRNQEEKTDSNCRFSRSYQSHLHQFEPLQLSTRDDQMNANKKLSQFAWLVLTSSTIMKTECFFVISLSCRKNSGLAWLSPPSLWIGSTTTAATAGAFFFELTRISSTCARVSFSASSFSL